MSPVYAVRGAEILVPAGAELTCLAEAAGDEPWRGLSAAGAFGAAGATPADGTPADATPAAIAGVSDRFMLPVSTGAMGGAAEGGQVLSFAKDAEPPAGWEWRPLRSAVQSMPERGWAPAARAMAYANWRSSSRYCGRCGGPNAELGAEAGRRCPACGAVSFPRISPAILAVVKKDGKLLLARNAQNASGFWSLIAGFVEPGETFEDCVKREVKEEVGIEVEALGYLGSQPWPFPDQLMLGFEARWACGELAPDGVEIAEAGWFGPEALPPIPRVGSLSRRLIDAALGLS